MRRKGFVDLQVNGYRGVDFSSPDLTLEQIETVTDALVRAGTVGFCATIVSSDLEIYERNLPLLARAMEKPGPKDHLLGIHMEGPYLSPLEGARGAHAASRMRRPHRSEFDRFQELASGRIALFTIAPELENALGLISYVRAKHSTRIALGHHLASREILYRAADAGATLITHLGNGCPNILPRHNNVLFHQLAMDSLSAGIITDGNHIPDDFILVVLRCKGADKVFVVSDAVSIAGFPPGIYEAMGNTVRLSEAGRVENVNGQHLVGSGCNMAQCMRHLRSLEFLTDEELWQVGLNNPLKILGFSAEPASWAQLPDFAF